MTRLKKTQRLATYCCMQQCVTNGNAVPAMPLLITITRIGPRKLDDDNLASACKYVRDQIATIIGTDDGSPLYTWRYKQRIGEYCVNVEITSQASYIKDDV